LEFFAGGCAVTVVRVSDLEISGEGWTRAFSFPIKTVMELECVVVVLTNPPTHEADPQNVVALSREDGRLLWKAPLIRNVPPRYVGSYYEIRPAGTCIELLNWAGVYLKIEPETGRVLSETEMR